MCRCACFNTQTNKDSSSDPIRRFFFLLEQCFTQPRVTRKVPRPVQKSQFFWKFVNQCTWLTLINNSRLHLICTTLSQTQTSGVSKVITLSRRQNQNLSKLIVGTQQVRLGDWVLQQLRLAVFFYLKINIYFEQKIVFFCENITQKASKDTWTLNF